MATYLRNNSQHFVRLDKAESYSDIIGSIIDAHRACVHGGVISIGVAASSGIATDMNHFWADHLQENKSKHDHVFSPKSLMMLISEINAFSGWCSPILDVVQEVAVSEDKKRLFVQLKAMK